MFEEKTLQRYTPEQEAIIEFLAGRDNKRRDILINYWKELHRLDLNAKKEISQHNRTMKNIKNDKEQAKNMVENLVDANIMPIITMPKKYWEKIKNKKSSIIAKETWIPGEKIIAGTIGTKPYNLDEDRVILKINCETDDIEPRITGKEKVFKGVIYFRKGEIPFSDIEEIKKRPLALP